MNFFLFSLGCKVNGYENSCLRSSFLKKGWQEVHQAESADLIVVNTCAVTSIAESKSGQHIRRFHRLAPKAILVVMGCYSEEKADECLASGASIVLGTTQRSTIFEQIERFNSTKVPFSAVDKNVRHAKYEEMGQMALTSQARAYLKIQDGCNNFCSYCLIPSLRGESRSREPLETLQEAKWLVTNGYKEIIIAGIHIGAYGEDLGDGSYRLADLLEAMLKDNPTLFRLRVSSLEESEIDDKFLALLAHYPAIASHLHIPLQSGSSSVLKRMKRHYDTAAFLAKLDKIRSLRPEIAITTDLIAGFPGESAEEWQETMDFCAQAHFAEIHVFPFSSRAGTLAASMKDQIDPRVKEARVHEMLALSKKLRGEYEAQFMGQSLPVLFEEYDEGKHLAYGHTSNYLLVKVPSLVPLHSKVLNVTYSKETMAD